ncbi:carbohydrate ABC transporter membrane protein 1 (CUT1 family) [Kineothrix alysoides]|uniref:Carbohydrate ABC transporter membrane protein 1 (CUT1 family) n=1 Tax=Kineothrix alysoides TaxID=1469948 RepID=A0A4R1QUJ9_9FIRM|nr:sugar ABC transporter permease [Kineothrix alysoides]TCL57187.1 carbohydrate ABC transporter membrane protein 1 (CUT1 family) [Kineothrix alysoides]
MDAKKAARMEKLEVESADLMKQIRIEMDMKKKQKLIAKRESVQRKATAIRNNRRISREAKRDLVAYSFIAPNFIGFAVFTLVPIVFAFLLAFMKWDGNNTMEFVALNNFKRLIGDTFFVAALKNTIIYVIGTVPLTMIASLALAIVLNQKIRARGFFRTVAFFPYVASLVAITAVWSMIFHPSKGPINYLLLNVFGVPQANLPKWFGGGLVLFTLILFSVWKYMGYYMVIYLAGLQGISAELYEAGSLDGASTWQKFKFITWPQLRATTFFVVVMLTINCFKVYDIAIMLAGGGDGKLSISSTVLVYYIYQNAFNYWDLGYSSAIAMVLFVLVLIVTLIQFRYEKKLGE